MQNLPSASTYEEEVKYMPWGKLISEILEILKNMIPENGEVLDLLCGTGNLLGRLAEIRSDVSYTGIDLEDEYILFARKSYPTLSFETADVLTWSTDKKFDAVVVTGGLHHIPYEQQDIFIAKLATLLKDDGLALVADPYIDDYSTEIERKISAAKLGYEYLVATIANGATDDVTKATADLIANDVLKVEYKTSTKKIRPMFEKYFSHIEEHKTWPESDSEYGDYCFVLRK